LHCLCFLPPLISGVSVLVASRTVIISRTSE
jgi:hypothetical protein